MKIMNNKLIPPTEYSNSGYKFSLAEYEQLPSTEKAGLERVKAIYVARDEGDVYNIEVVILREGKFHPLSEDFKLNPEGTKLRLPCSNEWGEYGWSFRNMEMAKDKYSKIEK